MRTWRWCAAIVLVAAGVVSAHADRAEVIAATYGPFSVTPPTPTNIVVCHGFGCKFRTDIGLSAADRAKLTQLLSPGKASAKAERQAVATAGAWFDRRIGPETGTTNHVAHAGMGYMFDPHQFDCIDASRNTTSLLLVLAELKLLRHHTVDVPVSRGYLLDTRPPHTTAVLKENNGGEQWAVDAWTRAYGQPPEIMPLARWRELE